MWYSSILDNVSFESFLRVVVSYYGNHQKGLINLSWIDEIWRTLRLPAVRVTHLVFLREKSRLLRTFFAG